MFSFDSVSNFVKEWGYVAVFLGSIVEGEVILLCASAFAAFGFLSIYKVFCIAFVTTVVVDQALFFIGYKVGIDWLVRKSQKAQRARDRVFALLHRMDIFFIFAFRFIWGIRTVSPLIIGSARIKPARFIIFNIPSGFCWAFACCFLGYVVADVVVDGKFDTMPIVVAISVIVAIISAGCMLFMKAKK
jgi:membrane protein DedA with SNARE-associated domain